MITSSQNPLIKQVKRLQRSRKARESEARFVVEGIQGVLAALDSDLPVHAVLWSSEQLTSELARERIERAAADGVRMEAVSAELLAGMAQRDHPAGLLAVVERRLTPLEALRIPDSAILVALVEISDPGNLGTILRSVDATGGAGVLLVGDSVDPFHPTAVKASAGTLFITPLVAVPTTEALLAWAEARGVALVGSSDRAELAHWDACYRPPLLLLMGAEATGLPHALLDRLPQVVRIPMQGQADSLNLGVATALLLYEVRRQLR